MQLADGFLDGEPLFFWIWDLDGVAFPGHQAFKAHTGRFVGQAREGEGGFAGLHAGAVHAGVELDEHVDLGAGGGGDATDLFDIGGAVDGYFDIGVAAEADQAFDFAWADDLIGDEQVEDAVGGHDFGFAELGAGDADGPGTHGQVGDGRDFDALGMRAPLHAGFCAQRGQALDIGLHFVEVHPEGGGVECVFGAADFAHGGEAFRSLLMVLGRAKAGKL